MLMQDQVVYSGKGKMGLGTCPRIHLEERRSDFCRGAWRGNLRATLHENRVMPLRMQREKSSITRGTFERSRNVREYSAKLEDGMAAGSEEDSWECGYFFCLKMSILRENSEALLGSRMFFCWFFFGR